MNGLYLDSISLCVEVVDLLLLPPNLVSQLLLLVCERVRLTVQPPVDCSTDSTQPSVISAKSALQTMTTDQCSAGTSTLVFGSFVVAFSVTSQLNLQRLHQWPFDILLG